MTYSFGLVIQRNTCPLFNIVFGLLKDLLIAHLLIVSLFVVRTYNDPVYSLQ